MWLLNTARAELKFFPTPESVPGGYAILSHVWDKKEQTFQEVQALPIQCAKDGTNPRDLVCDKVREFCIIAERGGHQWGWADMCCINKTSSTELSEAIVSMYRYYSLADVCYAYLRDVPTASEDYLCMPMSAFEKSRWHKRGWTLQELIAPSSVVFLSCTWEILGTKEDLRLAYTLEGITRVPAAVLRRDEEPSTHCIAARMSWAANRETTRPEDEAYCLMGIFEIFMPPLYGEGRNAFVRLQEEIMRQEDDPSIFAWGDVHSVPVAGSDQYPPLKMWPRPGSDLGRSEDSETRRYGSFANSPSDFRLGHRMKRRKEQQRRPSRQSFLERFKRPSLPDLTKLPTFNISSYGVVAHLPVFQTLLESDFVALLLGIEFVDSDDRPRTLGLFLHKTASPDPSRPRYATFSSRYPDTRLCELPEGPWELAAKPGIKLEWKTIYILRSSTTTQSPASGLQMLTQILHTPFHIYRSHIITLLQDPGVTFGYLEPRHPTAASFRKHVLFTFEIRYPSQKYPLRVHIYLGLCAKASPGSSPQHWVRITEWSQLDVTHICAEHHVDLQPRQTQSFAVPLQRSLRSFGDTSRLETSDPVALEIQVELAFRPYIPNPTHVRTVHINFKAVPVKDPIKNGSTSSRRQWTA